MTRNMPTLLTGVLACALLMASTTVAAAGKQKQPETLPDVSWVPPEDSFDWIQLKSGEWLKGKLKGLQDRELEFDSSEMDYQTFDWEKIRQLRTGSDVQVRLVDEEIYTGRAMITPTEVWMLEDPGHKWPRDQLQSVTPAGSKERSYWSGDISVGLTKRSGNVEQTDYNNYAHVQRRNPSTRLLLTTSPTVVRRAARSIPTTCGFPRDWTPGCRTASSLCCPASNTIPTCCRTSATAPPLAPVSRMSCLYSPDFEWSVTGGPAYQWLRHTSAQPGEPERREGMALGLSSRLEWDITKDIDLTLEYKGQYASKSAGDSTHHALAQLSVDITKRIEVDISLTWDRTVSPELTAEGTQPSPTMRWRSGRFEF
jgi:hypothetical protein